MDGYERPCDYDIAYMDVSTLIVSGTINRTIHPEYKKGEASASPNNLGWEVN